MERTFTNESSLRYWLKQRMYESGNPEAYTKWLEKYFEEGNTISIHGEEYDYITCLEII